MNLTHRILFQPASGADPFVLTPQNTSLPSHECAFGDAEGAQIIAHQMNAANNPAWNGTFSATEEFFA